MRNFSEVIKYFKSYNEYNQYDLEVVTMLQSIRNFLDKNCGIIFFPKLPSSTCVIAHMIVLKKDGLLLKVNELLEDLRIYNKTLDRKNKPTSPPTRVLADIFNDFYSDENLYTGKNYRIKERVGYKC